MKRSILLAVLVAACGGEGSGDDGPPVDGNGSSNATCTVTATATANTGNRTITGVGMAQCDVAASLALNVCVQWNPDGTFKDIMCQQSTNQGTKTFMVENVSSCGIATGRKFRARVIATVNGTAKPEVLSSEVGCE